MAEKISAAMETATTLANKVFEFVTANEWLSLIFIVGVVVPIGFTLINRAKGFARD